MRRSYVLAGFGVGAVVVALVAFLIADRPGQSDRAETERIVHEYILAHPEIIPQAMERLQQQTASKAIDAERAALERPFAGAWAGNPRGDVTLVMFTDYSCGYCKASVPSVDRLLREDPNLKVVWREIPVLGPQSETAARAALAAARQGRYLGFHRALFGGGRPDEAGLMAAARAAGLDAEQLGAALADPAIAREIQGNLALAGRLGIGGTPAFVIGDRLIPGAVSYDVLKQAVDGARSS
jgi:protein-disulfide isomerase